MTGAPYEKRNWVEWHRAYDDPDSRLSKRLRVVQELLRDAIDRTIEWPIRIISMCAGEGRDVICVLADHPRRNQITARLVEMGPRNAAVARASAREAGLDQVQVVEADAALTDSYAGAVPADIILACGIFGNISEEDIRRTIEQLPYLSAFEAFVIWTRGHWGDNDVPEKIRQWFEENAFEEDTFIAPPDETFRVGMHTFIAEPQPFQPGVRMFTFFR